MRRRLLLVLIVCVGFSAGCPKSSVDPAEARRQAEVAAVAVTADDPVDDDAPGVDDPTMGEAPAELLDVDGMSDDELQTACFQGSQAACDRLGH